MSPPARDLLALAALAAGLTAFKAWLTAAAGVDLHFDEAQYWTWSRHLDWGYYSKGPLVAWAMAAAEALLGGEAPWQLRLPAWLGHGLWLAALYGLAWELWGRRAAAWWAVALGLASPLHFTLGLVHTTDVWVLLAWTAALWALARAVGRGEGRGWLLAGVAVGVGALAKLSVGLLPALAGLALLARPAWRPWLRRPEPWLAAALVLLLMAPMLAWNAAHGWVMLRHELGHLSGGGGGGGEGEPSLPPPLRFLLEQALALSPPVAVALAAALGRPPAGEARRLVWWVSVGTLAFFLVKALGGKVQVNWPAPAYAGAFALLAGRLPVWTAAWRRTVLAGFALGVVALAVAYFPPLAGFDPARAPFKEVRGWRGAVEAMAAQAPPVDFLLAPNYKTASEAAYYWPRPGGAPVRVYVLPGPHRRRNQFDLWPGLEREAGRDGLWLSTVGGPPEAVRAAFAGGCRDLPPVEGRDPWGGVVRRLHGAHCRGYRPVPWPEPAGY